MPGGFKIGIQHGIDAFIATVSARPRDVEVWTVSALNATAGDVQRELVALMAQVFDRPTRYTLNALHIKSARRGDLSAEVRFKDQGLSAAHYLLPEVQGGPRRHKSHELRLIRAGLMRSDEFAVPGQGVSLDAYGNMKAGEIERILSQVGAAEQFSGYQANATKRSLKRAKGKGSGRYFALRPDAASTRYMRRAVAPGIYWRKGAREIVPVIRFVKAPQYRVRFPMYEKAAETVRRVFAANFRAAMVKYPIRW
jgi:hypothetical protein